MAKRQAIDAQLRRVHRQAEAAEAEPAAVRSEEPAGYNARVNTGVTLRKSTLGVLRRLGVAVAEKHGGRASVSGAIEHLVRENQDAIERLMHESGNLPD